MLINKVNLLYNINIQYFNFNPNKYILFSIIIKVLPLVFPIDVTKKLVIKRKGYYMILFLIFLNFLFICIQMVFKFVNITNHSLRNLCVLKLHYLFILERLNFRSS